MKDRLRDLVGREPAHRRAGVMREFLQCMALRVLHTSHDFGPLAFIGGTALRLLFDLPRFSEDLDFSLMERGAVDFDRLSQALERMYTDSGIAVETRWRSVRAVQSFWLKFPHLLHEVGVSRDPRRVLSIKLEVDCNPPAGAVVERHLINRYFPLALVHFDLSSLFAGKLHAVLTRPYVKGRDYYDLVWYRTRHPKLVPNINLLNTALRQTKWKGKGVDETNWKSIVGDRIRGVDWDAIVRDVSPFLEDEGDLEAMTLEYVLPLFAEQ